MFSTTKQRFAAAAVLVGALALTGCTAGGPSPTPTGEAAASGPISGGTLTYLSGPEPPVWDAQKLPGLGLLSINSSIFDTIVTQEPDGSYGPGLAESWEISDDGLTYTFHLRDDVVFHDGEKFDAAALQTVLERTLDPDNALPPLNGIAITGFDQPDDTTLVITLKNPSATVIHSFSTPHIPVYSPKVLAEHTAAELASNPLLSVGTGPFKVTGYTKGSSITLERNDDYAWAPDTIAHDGPAYLDEIDISFVPEPQARVGALASGQADAIDAVPPLNAPELIASGATILEAVNAGLPYTLSINATAAPTDDIKVREALRAAISLDDILESIYGGYYDKAWTVITPITPPAGSYDQDLEGTWGYDLELAASLLDEAGWTEFDADGYRVKDGKRLTLQWVDDNVYILQDQRQQLGEAIATSVKEYGIEIIRTPYDTAAYTAELAKGIHNLAPSSRGYADVGTPAVVFAGIHRAGGPGAQINYGLTQDADIDAWYAEITVSGDPERRAELGRLIQERVNEEVYAIPLYVPKKLVGVKGVEGWTFDAVGYTDSFYGTWLTGQS